MSPGGWTSRVSLRLELRLLKLRPKVDMFSFAFSRGAKSVKLTPIAVDPNLIASREYSTWKRRPSGENVLVLLDLWESLGV